MTQTESNFPKKLSHKITPFFGLSILLLFVFTNTFAQLERFPVQRKGATSSAFTKSNTSARTKADVPLGLPFFDDFSKTTAGIYPNEVLWDSSFCVWVNDAMAINPPTRNVATFDGLDSAGNQYNALQVLQNGFTDSLTSKKIDLSENEVSIGERFSTYLSFFYQWQGNGEPPDPSDYLRLEFLDDQDNWVPVMTIKTKDTFDRSLFYDTIIAINDLKYFHDEFQFRFKSFGRQSGPYDTWNIDYVYLNKNRYIDDLSFPDQAASASLSNLFAGSYRAMPYDHFKAGSSLVAPKFTVFNLREGDPDVVTYVTEATFTNYTDGIPTTTYDANLHPSNQTTGINDDGSAALPALTTRTVTLQHLPNISDNNQFDPSADSVKIELQVDLITGDNINNDTGLPADDYDANYAPIDFRVNDTIMANYTLKDYYAYDDGHAEYSAGLIQAGNLVAYEFELQGVDQDVLTGFDIYFPPYAVSSNLTVEFYVYPENLLETKQNASDPDPILLSLPPYTVHRKGVDEFQRVRFLPALLIPTKKFYIGWREPVSGDVLVGLDMNNDTGSKIYVNTSGTWYQNDRVVGSLMIRPIFGEGSIDPVQGIEDPIQFSLYPNPNTGTFYIEGDTDSIEIFSITGKRISFESEKIDHRTLITVNQPSGLYVLRTSKGRASKTQKIVISR